MRVLVSGNYLEVMDEESRAMWEDYAARGGCEILPPRSTSWEWGNAQHRQSTMLGATPDSLGAFKARAIAAYRAMLGVES